MFANTTTRRRSVITPHRSITLGTKGINETFPDEVLEVFEALGLGRLLLSGEMAPNQLTDNFDSNSKWIVQFIDMHQASYFHLYCVQAVDSSRRYLRRRGGQNSRLQLGLFTKPPRLSLT